MLTYFQVYNPAAHILRRGLSDVSIFTWMMLGGETTATCPVSGLRQLDDVPNVFMSSIAAFGCDAVIGPGVRIEAVSSGRSTSKVLCHLNTYGCRLVQFSLSSVILVRSDKTWPSFIEQTLNRWFVRVKV